MASDVALSFRAPSLPTVLTSTNLSSLQIPSNILSQHYNTANLYNKFTPTHTMHVVHSPYILRLASGLLYYTLSVWDPTFLLQSIININSLVGFPN